MDVHTRPHPHSRLLQQNAATSMRPPPPALQFEAQPPGARPTCGPTSLATCGPRAGANSSAAAERRSGRVCRPPADVRSVRDAAAVGGRRRCRRIRGAALSHRAGQVAPEAAAQHLQRAAHAACAARGAARTIQLRVQALQAGGRRRASRRPSREAPSAPRGGALGAAGVGRQGLDGGARAQRAPPRALHGDLDGSRRAAAASAPAYGVAAVRRPSAHILSPAASGGARRWRRWRSCEGRGGGGLHQEFMRGAHGGRVRADKQHGARGARELAARRASTELARAAPRRGDGRAPPRRPRGWRRSPALTTRQGRRCLRMRSSTATATAALQPPVGQRASSGGADWSWSPCGTRHPPTPMQSRSVPTLNFQRVWRRRGADSSRRTPGRTPRTPQTAHSTYTSSGPLSAMPSGRRGSYGTPRVSLPARVMSRCAPRHARRATHARRAPDARRRAVARRGGRRASGASSHSSPASERGPSTPPQRNSSTSPGLAARRRARRAPRDRPRGRRRRRRQGAADQRRPSVGLALGRRGDGPPSPNMRGGATSPSGRAAALEAVLPSSARSRSTSLTARRRDWRQRGTGCGGEGAPALHLRRAVVGADAAVVAVAVGGSPPRRRRRLSRRPPPTATPSASSRRSSAPAAARASAHASACGRRRARSARRRTTDAAGRARGRTSSVVTPRGNVMFTHGMSCR